MNLRILALSNNGKGDLFTRLVTDLFFGLGYTNFRLNVAESGREIDIQGTHRHEPRKFVAECKAHADKMGGTDLNTFFGVLAREREAHAPAPVNGYYISLNGFTETAIQQENNTPSGGLVLLDGRRTIEELIASHVVVSLAKATEKAGQCAQANNQADLAYENAELLAHDKGYIWAIHYSRGKQRCAYALIHADGTALAEELAESISDTDKTLGGALHTLQYLRPSQVGTDRHKLEQQAVSRYRAWLGEECGFVQLDGLPADNDLSATRLRLERLFVPLQASLVRQLYGAREVREDERERPHPIGVFLRRALHVAILAAPGGGKSTLVKRLALAYSNARSLEAVDDHLPQKDWLPILLRCRDLRDRTTRAIPDLIAEAARHAGLSLTEFEAFQDHIQNRLRAGNILLLIDGLDEISDESARKTFANNLRTFLSIFPKIGLVLTSREAGFRAVAGVIAAACTQIRIAPLDEADVMRLCDAWHVEVLGNKASVKLEAARLGAVIWKNSRIRSLSENPLLLTTLLVVKRSLRELPRNRTALYREAIRVLLRTWNVEGYEPMEEEETLAQLSYIAGAMFQAGTLRITRSSLLALLYAARKELDVELQFTEISPTNFVERIEYRSSLLMQVGHEQTENGLEPVYEFRHLTFQEYLAARGYVEEQYPGRSRGLLLKDSLGSFFGKEQWREVIALASVLAGRRAEPLVDALTQACLDENGLAVDMRKPETAALRQCILDEVQATPATLRRALTALALGNSFGSYQDEQTWLAEVCRGKFGQLFSGLVEEGLSRTDETSLAFVAPAAGIARHRFFESANYPEMSRELFERLCRDLKSDRGLDQTFAALATMDFAFRSGTRRVRGARDKGIDDSDFVALRDALTVLLDRKVTVAVAAAWALAWIGQHDLTGTEAPIEEIQALFGLWRRSPSRASSWFACWALAAQRIRPREAVVPDAFGDCDSFLREVVENPSSVSERVSRVKLAAFVIAFYRRSPWTDAELASLIPQCEDPYQSDINDTIAVLLNRLGPAAENAAKDFTARRKEHSRAVTEKARTKRRR